jgi:hypothetical protein
MFFKISSREENKNKQHKAEKRTKNDSFSNEQRPDLYIELEELHHKKDGLFYNSTGELSEHQWRIVSRYKKKEVNCNIAKYQIGKSKNQNNLNRFYKNNKTKHLLNH